MSGLSLRGVSAGLAGAMISLMLVVPSVLASPAAAASLAMPPVSAVAEAAVGGSGWENGVPSASGTAPGWVPPVWPGASADGGPRPPATEAAVTVAEGGELVGLRTRNASTFRRPDGSLQTRVSTGPQNFADGQGRWKRLQTDLVPARGGSLGVRAADYTLSLPRDLSAPVVVGQGAALVSFGLRGAAGTRRAEGSTATYAGALPGVDVLWTAQPSGVKEELRLGSAQAPSSFVYDVTVPAGVSLRLAGEEIEVVSGGSVVAIVPAPFAFDEAGVTTRQVAYTLEGTGPAYVLSVELDRSWLESPERVFPVIIDPDVWFGGTGVVGATLDSATPTTASLTGAPLRIGRTSSGAVRRTLLRFDGLPGSIPPNAVITRAQLSVFPSSYTQGSLPANAPQFSAHALTSGWTAGTATWNTRNGSTAWTAAGGDVNANPDDSGWFTSTLNEAAMDLTRTAAGWLSGEVVNHGVQLKMINESQVGFGELHGIGSNAAPYLLVNWEPSYGVSDSQKYWQADLTDRVGLRVNLANGNLALTQTDLQVTGPGLDLSVARTYNSRRAANDEDLGHGWLSHGGPGVFLSEYRTSVVLTSETGTPYVFVQTNGGATGASRTWVDPPGLGASLSVNGSGQYVLTYHRSGVKQTFSFGVWPRYNLVSTADRNANTISYGYSTTTNARTGQPVLASVTDTAGRVHTINRSGDRLTGLTDAAGRSLSYGYTGADLTSVADLAGGVTSFGYDASHNLTRVTSPDGFITVLGYDSSRRVTSIVRVTNNTALTGPTTVFDYTAAISTTGPNARGTTSVTDPRNNATSYSYDTRDRVRTVTNALGKQVSSAFSANNDATSFTGSTAGTAGGGATQTSTATYDSKHNPTGVRLPTKAGTSATYAGTQTYQPDSATDSHGNKSVFGYDTVGNRTATTTTNSSGGTGTGAITSTAVLQGSTDAAYGGTVNCGPTVNGVVTAARPGSVCEVRDGQYVATAPTAHRTAYRYDAQGNRVSETPGSPSPLGARTFDYSRGLVVGINDGKGQYTGFWYDALDRRVRTIWPDGTYTTSQYTSNGNLYRIREHTAAGTVTREQTYGNDNLNQPYSVITPEGTALTIYDAASNLGRYSDPGGQVNYTHNAADQLSALAEPGGDCAGYSPTNLPPAGARCTLFTLDDDGRRTATRYPGGTTQTATPDDSGRPTRIRSVSGTTVHVDLGYSYTDSAAVPASPDNPSSDTAIVRSRTDHPTGSTSTYDYDRQVQLTAETTRSSAGAVTGYRGYCYDRAGNRTGVTTSASTSCASPTVATPASAGNTLVSIAGSAVSHDANGNQTAVPANTTLGTVATSTSWNNRDHATSFTAGGTSLPQTYFGTSQDPRLTTKLSSTTSAALLTGQLGIAREIRTVNGTAQTPSYFTRDPAGTLISARTGTSSSYTSAYYLTDNLGTVLKLVNPAGTAVNSYGYDAWGRAASTPTEGVRNPFRYTSGYHDPGTGLTKLGIRYYDPTLGRFTQPDPTGQDPHYTYAGNNPVSFVDPSGAVTIGVQGCFIVALGGCASLNLNEGGSVSVGISAGAGLDVGVAGLIGGGAARGRAITGTGCYAVCGGISASGPSGGRIAASRARLGAGVRAGGSITYTQFFGG